MAHASSNTCPEPRQPSSPASPLVTVVISSFNPGPHLVEAVHSILGQTHGNLELVVVDDGSTDGSADAIAGLRDPRLRVVRQERAGKAAALNRALATARGEFYAIQDADDVSLPRRIERQLRALVDHPEVAGVFCGKELIIEGEHVAPRMRTKSAEECRRDIEAMRMPGHDPTAMFRMSMVRDLEYDVSLAIGQGFDYVLRVGERHPLIEIGECLYAYRIHTAGATKADWERRERFVALVLEKARRRRGLAENVVGTSPPVTPRRRDLDNHIAAHFLESVVDQRNAGRVLGALRTAFRCWRRHPTDWDYAKPLLAALLPPRLLRQLRSAS